MQIKETPAAYQQRMNNLDHARRALDMINQQRVKARYIFEKLLPGQQKYLLQASGIHRNISSANQLSDFDIERLSKGLARIKAITDAFSSCDDKDFKPKENIKQVA